MTSPDGITWTLRSSAADNGWFSVCWSPERSLFVAVAFSGTGNRVMTSPDGITWTARSSAADNDWYSVCWSPERSLFVAVASTGTGGRVMSSRGRQDAASPDGFVATLGANTFTGIQTVQAAATQDAVKIAGRAGGTSSYAVTVTPLALSASRTWSLPDRDDTFAGLGAQTFTGQQTITDTTDATSKDTGSLVTEGGIGVEKSIYAGGPSITAAGQVRFHYDSSTGERGTQVKISNRTGETSVKGKLVHPSSTNDNAVELVSAASPYTPCGVIYEAGIANGSDMWIWCPGSIVEFLMENSDATTRQDWLRASATTNGRVQSSAVPTPPNADSHFTECGHALESNAGGTDQLVLGFFHTL